MLLIFRIKDLLSNTCICHMCQGIRKNLMRVSIFCKLASINNIYNNIYIDIYIWI